jgi:hypothetical protein
MTDDRRSMPGDWDTLMDRGVNDGSPPPTAAGPDAPEPPALTVMAAAWADLVGILAVCTGALVAILLLGERPALSAFAWAAALGVAWWIFSAAVLVVVRQATPGMLLAGVSFSDPVRPNRVCWVLVAALLGVITAGLSGVVGGRRSILRRAAASEIVDGAA